MARDATVYTEHRRLVACQHESDCSTDTGKRLGPSSSRVGQQVRRPLTGLSTSHQGVSRRRIPHRCIKLALVPTVYIIHCTSARPEVCFLEKFNRPAHQVQSRTSPLLSTLSATGSMLQSQSERRSAT